MYLSAQCPTESCATTFSNMLRNLEAQIHISYTEGVNDISSFDVAGSDLITMVKLLEEVRLDHEGFRYLIKEGVYRVHINKKRTKIVTRHAKKCICL